MCGRYGFVPPINFKDRFEFENDLDDYQTRYNVAPSARMPIVTRNSPNQIRLARWGLIPSWSKTSKLPYSTINARAESVETSAIYRGSFKNKRCLIPASFFFEWLKVDDTKTPYCIKLKNEDVFAFAGLYDEWINEKGEDELTYTIITTTPNNIIEKIHNRMPVILNQVDESKWLDIDAELEKIRNLMKPFEGNMEAYIVSSLVNSARNESPEVIKPLKN